MILMQQIKLYLVSDLHRECHASSKSLLAAIDFSKFPHSNICVLAGDIGYPLLERRGKGVDKLPSVNPQFLHILKTFRAQFCNVLFVTGNHEYHQARDFKVSVEQVDAVVQRACDEAKVIFLNCKSWVDVETKVEFLGCTLWSDMSEETWQRMEDSKAFRTNEECQKKHIEHVTWLAKTLASPARYPRIVVTHHLPSFKLVHAKYKDSPLNDGFCSDQEKLLKGHSICAWLCGHTHERITSAVCSVPIFSNPLGYPGEKRETSFSQDEVEIDLNSPTSCRTKIAVSRVP
jgi:Icc-related predicted phosphoesterase